MHFVLNLSLLFFIQNLVHNLDHKVFHAGKSNCIFLPSTQNHTTWMPKQQCFWDDFSHQQVCLYLHILLFLLFIRFAFLDVDIAVKDFRLPACTWSQALPPVKTEQLKLCQQKSPAQHFHYHYLFHPSQSKKSGKVGS